MKAYTSRSRFDETRRFVGVYAQMGRVQTDADANEEVSIRVMDARRRTSDLVSGAPDDGWRLGERGAIDVVTSLRAWSGQGLDLSDQRFIRPEIGVDRYEPESLPFVLRARGYTELLHTLPAPVTLAAVPRGAGGAWSAASIIVEARFEIPPGDDEPSVIQVVLVAGDGTRVLVDAPVLDARPAEWTLLEIPLTSVPGLGATLTGWGLTGIPPRATVRLAALTGRDAAMRPDDFVIRGGDGTLVGAGRMYVEGARAFLEGDLRYQDQPDLPAPPAPSGIVVNGDNTFAITDTVPTGATPYHLAFLDVWEREITVDEDSFLVEPALDGLDTTVRTRLVAQVRLLPTLLMEEPGRVRPDESLPDAVGGARLTTDLADGELPDRYPAEPFDTCRDRCLHTEQVALGTGYRGSENLHVRVELLDIGGRMAVLWSRDNASTVLPLVSDAADTASRLFVSAEDATRLAVGDLVVLEDEVTRLFGGRTPLLRRVRSLTPDLGDGTGAVELEAAGATDGLDADPLPVGGAPGRPLLVSDRASLRVWDGGDWVVPSVRYNLPDGITFAFPTTTAPRSGDWWSFTARIHDPDGDARGVLERLVASPPHGPVHRHLPLARIRYAGTVRAFEDLRPRFLPLSLVRDRLIELGEAQPDKGPFVVVVGDGVRTFGDINQDMLEGITGDEAITAALELVRVDENGNGGGTVYIRAGQYALERPVVLDGQSKAWILGDGDASELVGAGAGGVFYLDGCGAHGAVEISHLRLRSAPALALDIGLDGESNATPAVGVVPEDVETDVAPLQPEDLRGGPTIVATGASIAARWNALTASSGRVARVVRRTMDRLRQLQRANPGLPLSAVPGAQTLYDTLQALPHGAVSLVDSESVVVRDCRIDVEESTAQATGAFITGNCRSIRIASNRIVAPVGLLAAPYAASLSEAFLFDNPRAGLAVDALDVVDNTVTAPAGGGIRGVQVADGRLDGLSIRHNRIEGFDVGVYAEDRAEYNGDLPSGRITIQANRVIDSVIVGIQVGADRCDIRDNEVRNADSENLLASAGLCSAGIQVVGQGVRVEGNAVALVAAANAPVLGVLAGIVIGDGLDDGTPALRPVFDVEVCRNRVEGPGKQTQMVGIWIGGPQPIADVRVRENVLRELGDAGIRALGGRAVTGLRIEDNRLEQVALAELPTVETDLLAQLSLLAAADIERFGNQTRPEPLLAALLGLTNPAPAHLDAALRWLERVYLRGGIVLSNPESAHVSGNLIAGVGIDGLAPTRELTDTVRTAAVCVTGGRDVVIEGNRVTDIRAPSARGGRADENVVGETPFPIVDTLDQIGVGRAGITVSSAGIAFGQSDLHAAAAALRRLFLDYVSGVVGTDDSTRERLGRRVYAPLDALAWRLRQTAEAPPEVADAIESATGALRAAQHEERHTEVAKLVASILSQLAWATAEAGPPQEVWEEIAAWDQLIYDAHGATLSLADRATSVPELIGVWEVVPNAATVSGTVPGTGADSLLQRQIIAAAGSSPSSGTLATALRALDWLAGFHDAYSADQAVETSDSLLGERRDAVLKWAVGIRRLVGQARTAMAADARTGATEAQGALSKARPQIAGLSQSLRDAGTTLAGLVDTAFRVVDTTPPPTPVDVADPYTTLTTALDWVEEWSDGRGSDVLQTGSATSADDARPSQRAHLLSNLQAERGQTSLTLLVIDLLDNQTANAGALTTPALLDAAVSGLFGLSAQLRGLVYDRPALRALANPVYAALRSATSATDDTRPALLTRARESLAKLRSEVEIVSLPGTATFGSVVAPLIEQRLAGLGAVALLLAANAPGGTGVAELREAYRTHYARALNESRTLGGARATAEAALNGALSTLVNATGETQRRAAQDLAELASELADALATRAGATGPLRAAAVLCRAATSALDAAPNVSDIQAYLGAHSDDLSTSLVGDLTASSDPAVLRPALELALERLAQGDSAVTGTARSPRIVDVFEPADGVFAASVLDWLRVAGNEVTDALFGIVIVGRANQVFGDVPRLASDETTDDRVVVEIEGNRLSACAASAIDVRPGSAVSAHVSVRNNHVFGSADLALDTRTIQQSDSANDAADLTSWAGQGVVRLVGSGDLVVSGNLTWENGHQETDALVHEIYADWRGSVVVRQNTIRHQGGEAGGAAILIVPEQLLPTNDLSAGALVQKLVRNRFLAVEPPPPPPTTRALADKEIKRSSLVRQASKSTFVLPSRSSTYLMRRAQPTLAATRFGALSKALTMKRPTFPLLARPLQAQRYVQVEGNDVEARGPALLILAQGTNIISTSVVGNELRSTGGAGAVYLRHTDSTVVTGNRVQCTGAVNVMVIRPDAAPVTVTGNVTLGDQPVAKTIRVAPGWQLLAQSSFASLASTLMKGVAILGAPQSTVTVNSTSTTTTASQPESFAAASSSSISSSVMASPAVVALKARSPISVSTSQLSLGKTSIQPAITLAPGKVTASLVTVPGSRGAVVTAQPPASTPPPPSATAAPTELRPDPAVHSLVVLGGSHVALVGNAASSGAVVIDAAYPAVLNP